MKIVLLREFLVGAYDGSGKGCMAGCPFLDADGVWVIDVQWKSDNSSLQGESGKVTN